MRAGGWCDWCGNSDRGSVKAGVGAVALLDRSEEEPQELGMAGGRDVGVGAMWMLLWAVGYHNCIYMNACNPPAKVRNLKLAKPGREVLVRWDVEAPA